MKPTRRTLWVAAGCICVVLLAGAFVAVAGAQPPTPIDEDEDDTDLKDGRIVPSEQVPPGIRATYGDGDLDRSSGGSGVSVAVIDTGVDRTHPDLRDRVTLCRDFTGETVRDGSCADANGHGTHVAGTIAADGGSDGLGIYGVAPEAEIYAFKACGDDGRCRVDALADAVRDATDEGADVVVLSLGGRSEPRIRSATEYATESGTVVLASSGNSGPGIGTILYPAAHPNVVAVGAVGTRDDDRIDPENYRIPEFSSRGSAEPFSDRTDGSLEIGAFGVDVLSPLPGDDYGTKTGTSMATPHAAGLTAKILAASSTPIAAPELRAELQKRAPRYDVTDGEHAKEGYDPASGFGIPTVSSPSAALVVSPEIPVDDEVFALEAGTSRSDVAIVEYAWDTTDDGEFDRIGERLELETAAGTHPITLRVTDAENASASVTEDVFVNDRPRLTIVVPEIRAGENATLEATVDNEFGEATIEWVFADGTTASGETATYRFDPGESTIEVTVTDEFGASTTETATVIVSPEEQGPIVSPALSVLAALAVLAIVAHRKRR